MVKVVKRVTKTVVMMTKFFLNTPLGQRVMASHSWENLFHQHLPPFPYEDFDGATHTFATSPVCLICYVLAIPMKRKREKGENPNLERSTWRWCQTAFLCVPSFDFSTPWRDDEEREPVRNPFLIRDVTSRLWWESDETRLLDFSSLGWIGREWISRTTFSQIMQEERGPFT